MSLPEIFFIKPKKHASRSARRVSRINCLVIRFTWYWLCEVSITERHRKLVNLRRNIMGLLTSNTFNNLNDLFINQLEDLYDAENRLITALPKMAEAASSRQLKGAFNQHLQQTKEHARRLEEIFGQLGCEPKRETCEAMKGLVREGAEMIDAKGSAAVKDAALIA